MYITAYQTGNVEKGLVNPPSPPQTMEGKGINFFNRLWRDSLCAIDSLLLNVLGTMFWILYWQMYCWLAAGCWLLAAFAFFFLFLLRFQKGYTDSPKNGPKKVGPLYSLPPLLITWGSELTLFTTPLLIASGHYLLALGQTYCVSDRSHCACGPCMQNADAGCVGRTHEFRTHMLHTNWALKKRKWLKIQKYYFLHMQLVCSLKTCTKKCALLHMHFLDENCICQLKKEVQFFWCKIKTTLCKGTALHITFFEFPWKKCISTAYQVHINCISSAYQLHINCVSTAYQLHITFFFLDKLWQIWHEHDKNLHFPRKKCISTAYQLHIKCISTAYQLLINCISTAYHLFFMTRFDKFGMHMTKTCIFLRKKCISTAYQVHINCISSAYQLHINCVSTAYQLHITFLWQILTNLAWTWQKPAFSSKKVHINCISASPRLHISYPQTAYQLHIGCISLF